MRTRSLTTMLVALALLAAAARAQDANAKKAAGGDDAAKKAKALPEGKVEVLQAVVMEVKGTAQARAGRKAKWQQLKVNDVLEPGTTIRTGRESHVALRVGKNASVLIERQSRVALPEIVQDGETLRTRLAMSFGQADIKVDRIGLRNDFGVATPTATLAVRGTRLRITWDAVRGFVARGRIGNLLFSIEVRYLGGILAFLSGTDSSSDEYKLPALDGFYETYILPLQGATDSGDRGDPEQTGPDHLENPRQTTGLQAVDTARGAKTIQPPPATDQ